MIRDHLDKNNLHHAYLLEGVREEIIPEIMAFMEELGIATSNNPDFCEIHIDNFKMDEAMFLRGMTEEKSFVGGKKIFIISANQFSLDAEHALLKMFEEPKKDTHFFLLVPEKGMLLPTLLSRFYHIQAPLQDKDTKEVEAFLKMSSTARINFLKDFLKIDDEDEEVLATDSVRAKSLRFLNILETVIHNNFLGVQHQDPGVEHLFKQIFQVRKFLRQPGSSTKSLMESLALIVPNY